MKATMTMTHTPEEVVTSYLTARRIIDALGLDEQDPCNHSISGDDWIAWHFPLSCRGSNLVHWMVEDRERQEEYRIIRYLVESGKGEIAAKPDDWDETVKRISMTFIPVGTWP